MVVDTQQLPWPPLENELVGFLSCKLAILFDA